MSRLRPNSLELPYFSLKSTGMVKRTFTALPFILPGLHLGMDFTARSASLSRPGLRPAGS